MPVVGISGTAFATGFATATLRQRGRGNLRRHQRVRLGITLRPQPSPGEGLSPWNLESEFGTLHTVFVKEGSIQFRSSRHGGTPFWLQSVVTNADSGHPRMAEEMTRRLVLVYERIQGQTIDTVMIRSSNQGATWTEAEVAIAGGKKPTVAASQTGILVFAAVVGNTIRARLKYPGKITLGEEFTVQAVVDGTKADMHVQDDTFHISQERGPHARWWLHAAIQGESATSNWWSADSCRTFRRGPA